MRRNSSLWLPFLGLLIILIGGHLLPLRFNAMDVQVASYSAFVTSPEASLTHGPIVGGVSNTEATIFVRTSISATVSILYSTDPDLKRGIHVTSEAKTSVEHDYTVHIHLTNLQPNSTYYYSVLINQKPCSCQARFTTTPTPETFVNFNFAVFSDLSGKPNLNIDAPAYKSAASDSPAFVLQIGDFDHRNPGDSLFSPIITIENWRKMHRDVLGDNAAGRDFASYIAPYFPLYHIWDDHDYGADNADGTAPWKQLATQAFLEYFPLPALPNQNGGLWYSFRYAQAEFFVLDLRSQRDPNANDEPPRQHKSMLDGEKLLDGQKEWLKNGLLSSTAPWKFIISSSVWNPNSKRVDSWYIFQEEQNELVNFIGDNHITGIVVISGDLHSGGAIDNGTNSFYPELSVPTTNVHGHRNCTSGYCGTWSEGSIIGIDPSGYGLVMVQHDRETGEDRAILQAKAEDGSIRIQHTVVISATSHLFLPYVSITQQTDYQNSVP